MELSDFRSRLADILKQAQALHDSTHLDFHECNYGALMPAKVYLGGAIGCMEIAMKSEQELLAYRGEMMRLSTYGRTIDLQLEESIDDDRRDEFANMWGQGTYYPETDRSVPRS